MGLFTCFKKNSEKELEKKIREIIECITEQKMKQENEKKSDKIVTDVKEIIVEESI